MRIVFYQDYLRVGGTESQTLFLASQFQKAGHDVWIVTNRPGGRLSPKLKELDLNRISLQSRDEHLNWRAPGLVRKMDELAPDAIILMGRNANTKGNTLRNSMKDVAVISTFRTGRRLPKSYFKSLQRAPMIYCNSEFSRSKLHALGVENPNVEVHPNACMIAEGDYPATRRSYDALETCIHVVYVAAFVPGKNHQSLIQMMPAILSAVPQLKLHLLGEGPLLKKCRNLVDRFGVSEQVIFEGYRDDVPAFLSGMDMAVSPSLEESMPNALVEVQHCGLPIVAYDVAGVSECFLDKESGILLPENDQAGFIRELVNLSRDPVKLKAMSIVAMRFARDKFDPKVRFDAFYNSVLKCSNRRE